MKFSRHAFSALLGGVVVASAAATEYQFSWTPASGGGINNAGGTIHSVLSKYNTVTKRFSWYLTLGAIPGGGGEYAKGMYLAVSPGPNPKGHAGELSILYFDASGSNPRLTAYAYNGKTDGVDSWKDGSTASGIQTPDRIKSSVNSPGWTTDLSVVDNGNGTKTYRMAFDGSDIIDHAPLYPGPGGQAEWTGIGYGNNIGVWMGTLTTLSTSYTDGFLSTFTWGNRGWLDGANFTTTVVPEPTSMAVLGLGALALLRKRKKS